jgi:hypothetical protein
MMPFRRAVWRIQDRPFIEAVQCPCPARRAKGQTDCSCQPPLYTLSRSGCR